MSAQNGQIEGPPHPKVKELDIVGTAEAAKILGVERPRIGRWMDRGVMPDLAAHLAATPVWYRMHIVAMLPWVESNRRRVTKKKKKRAVKSTKP